MILTFVFINGCFRFKLIKQQKSSHQLYPASDEFPQSIGSSFDPRNQLPVQHTGIYILVRY